MSSILSASSLDDFVGMERAKRVLVKLFEPDSAVHAVLLYGARGSGKRAVARLLAKTWMCTDPSSAGPCDQCQACRAFELGTALDFQLVEPQPPSYLIRAAAITPEVREGLPATSVPVLEFFRLRAALARNRVVVIHEADRMNAAAANALLKTLEEPQPHSRLVLTTEYLGSVMPTIVSRCLAIACTQPSIAQVEERMGPLSAEEVRLTGGSPGLVERARQWPELYAELAGFFERLSGQLPSAALALSEEFRELVDKLGDKTDQKGRAAQAEALRLLGAWLRSREEPMPQALAMVAEAHRRVTEGNASFGLLTDSLIAAILVSWGTMRSGELPRT
jgi:DNA polymerase-3 subunit delta'